MMDAPATTVHATQLDRDNPWPGLESFEENARDYFHGRGSETEDLLRRVADAPLTVLFGKSGLGKTSILKAGLFPRLREKNFLPVHVRLDIRPDAPELGEQLRDGLLAVIARERIDAPPFNPGETLWEYLHRADLELWNEQNYPLTPVLVLDQFEEVFTLGERLPESVEGCKIDLGDLAENRIPAALASRLAVDPSAAQGLDLRRMSYKLVVTLREDFLPHLESWRAAVPSLGRVRVRLLPMRPDQALSAVYDTAPHLMDKPLARRIVAFVAAAQMATTQAQGEGAAQVPIGGGEIEPALLSLFCRGLNERRKQQGSERFDEQLLEGAQQGIIADYYRSCIEGLPDSVSRFIESDLITEKGFRNSYAKDDAVPAFLTEEQLDRLINRRLLRVEERYGTARIELTHDLLTRAVMADRDRRRVEEEKAALARRAEESRQALAMQARTQRRRVLVMGIVAAVCLAFAGFAMWQWRAAVAATKASEKAKTASEKAKIVAEEAKTDADTARSIAERAKIAAVQAQRSAEQEKNRAQTAETEAQTQARLAETSAARELVARGSSEARRMETEARLAYDDSGPALVKATLLSVASVRSSPTVDGQISLTRFLRLLPKAPLWRRTVAGPAHGAAGHGRRTLAVSPDGARIAVAGESGPVQLLDARTGQPLRSFEVTRHADRTVLAFSPNGAFLVLGCGHQACVLDAVNGQELARLPSADAAHGEMVWAASFSPDGKRLAMSSYQSGDVLVYDVATWHTAATIHAGEGTVFSVAFSHGGEWLAVGAGSEVQLWRPGHDEAPAARMANSGLVWSIAFQPDDSGFITAGQRLQEWRIVPGDGSTTRLDPGASKQIGADTVLPVSWHGQSCFAAAAPDAVFLLCGDSLDEVLRVPVSSAAQAISIDGRWLFNEQNNGVLAAWPLDAALDAFRIRVGTSVRSMALTEHGDRLAAATDSGEVAIVGIDRWKERKRLRLPPPAAPVDRVTASSDGRWLAVAQGPSLHVFDAGTWREVASGTYDADVAGSAFSAGGRWLVAVTGTTVVVRQPGGWRERRLEHDGTIEGVKVSPDGQQLATTTRWSAGHDSGVHLTRLFDLASGNETAWQYTSGGGNISQEFMRDEAARRQRSLAGGDTAAVRAAAAWPDLELEERDARMSADGAWIVGFGGSVASLSDVASTRAIGEFNHGDKITSVRFIPAYAPRWLVTAGEDGTLAVWPIRTADLANEACTRLHAMFDREALGKLIADAHAEGSCEAK
jgi:WD40 repeat protein